MSYPEWETSPIKCAKRKCQWKGYEKELARQPTEFFGATGSTLVCPQCGSENYQFMNDREIKKWKETMSTKTI